MLKIVNYNLWFTIFSTTAVLPRSWVQIWLAPSFFPFCHFPLPRLLLYTLLFCWHSYPACPVFWHVFWHLPRAYYTVMSFVMAILPLFFHSSPSNFTIVCTFLEFLALFCGLPHFAPLTIFPPCWCFWHPLLAYFIFPCHYVAVRHSFFSQHLVAFRDFCLLSFFAAFACTFPSPSRQLPAATWTLHCSSLSIPSFPRTCVHVSTRPAPPASCSRGALCVCVWFCVYRARRVRTGTVLLCDGDVLVYVVIIGIVLCTARLHIW